MQVENNEECSSNKGHDDNDDRDDLYHCKFGHGTQTPRQRNDHRMVSPRFSSKSDRSFQQQQQEREHQLRQRQEQQHQQGESWRIG